MCLGVVIAKGVYPAEYDITVNAYKVFQAETLPVTVKEHADTLRTTVTELRNKLKFLYFHFNDSWDVPIGEWLNCDTASIKIPTGTWYPSNDLAYEVGFHCFLCNAAAEDYRNALHDVHSAMNNGPYRTPGLVVRKVKIRGVHTIGLEQGRVVAVASKIYVCKEDKDYVPEKSDVQNGSTT
jgi:hypothetical protein